MAKSDKKREPLESKMGRPKEGALGTFDKKIRDLIWKLRGKNAGWGADSILIELEDEYKYDKKNLPSVDSVNRYLKQEGFVKEREPKGEMPLKKCKGKVRWCHQLWEMDAQGTTPVSGLGNIATINIKDIKSKVHCGGFPIHVKGLKSQPWTSCYLWAMRLAFEEYGLPLGIQVDKDSVFIDSTSGSPFPSQVYLFLIGLGVKFCFITVPPPYKQSTVERSHQTMEIQVIMGKEYENWQSLYGNMNKRRKVMNERLPNRSLGRKAPLEVFPQARRSRRPYSVKKEEQMIDMTKVFKYLGTCKWFRHVGSNGTINLGGQTYYIRGGKSGQQIQIKFCNRAKNLVFRDGQDQILFKSGIKGMNKNYIMGGTVKQLLAMKNKILKSDHFPLTKIRAKKDTTF